MTATIDYRELRRDDYPVFREMLTAYYREGEDADTEQEVLDAFISDLFSMAIERKIDGCFICLEGEAVGFALWTIDTPDGAFSEIPGYGTILEIGIEPRFRGKGYGSLAVEHAERQMRLAGAEHFYVSVYPLADKFWTRCGYAKTENTASNGLFIYKK